MKKGITFIIIAITFSFIGFYASDISKYTNQDKNLLKTYTNIAHDNYKDTLLDAKELKNSIEEFSLNPNKQTFNEAKIAWLKSRESYGQTEIFRLSNGPIDNEEGWVAQYYGALEGQINAWPLDEAMIDYTIDANGYKTSNNIINSKNNFKPSGEDSISINIKDITVETITELNENGGDNNVASGYHAIEFLLWGQDQDYSSFITDKITNGALISGQRPLSDFTTNKNAKRRLAYLQATSQKIVDDLTTLVKAWSKNISTNCEKDSTGCYRGALLSQLKGKDSSKNIASKDALKDIFTGMGVYIKSELANERIAVAALTPSEEDEHSCFSDNTHRDIVTNYQGFKNILLGTYNGKDYGYAIIDTLPINKKDSIEKLLKNIEIKINKIDLRAKTIEHFDYQIRPNNPNVKTIINLKNQLRSLGDKMVEISLFNNIKLSIEDVTDNEETQL